MGQDFTCAMKKPNLAKLCQDQNKGEIEEILEESPSLVNHLFPVFDDGLSMETKYNVFHMSAVEGNIEIFKYLLKSLKLEVNYPDGFGRTTLFHACRKNNLEIVQMLLQNASIDVNKSDPLTISVQNGSVEIFNLLIKKGAKVNDIKNLIYLATVSNKLEILESLFKIGKETEDASELLNFNIYEDEEEDDEYSTLKKNPLYHSVKKNFTEVALFLLENGADPNIKKALHLGCKNGNLEVVKLMVEKGADVHHKNPLLNAIESGNEEVVKLILSNGGNEDINKGNPFFKAAINGHTKIVEELIKHNPNIPETIDENWNTVLHFLATGKKEFCYDILNSILNSDLEFDIDQKNKDGNTSLHIASISPYKRSGDIVKILMVAKAKKEITNKKKENCIAIAFNEYKKQLITKFGEKLVLPTMFDSGGLDDEDSLDIIDMKKMYLYKKRYAKLGNKVAEKKFLLLFLNQTKNKKRKKLAKEVKKLEK